MALPSIYRKALTALTTHAKLTSHELLELFTELDSDVNHDFQSHVLGPKVAHLFPKDFAVHDAAHKDMEAQRS